MAKTEIVKCHGMQKSYLILWRNNQIWKQHSSPHIIKSHFFLQLFSQAFIIKAIE